MTPFQPDDSQSKWRRVLGLGIVIGAGSIIIGSNWSDRSSLSAAFLLAGASLFTGVLPGFIFGIPKTLRNKDDAEVSASPARGDYLPNTNLEDISDWLTKMLVGVGLVELGHLPGFLKSIGQYWAPSLGTKEASATGLIVYFGVLGFLLGYLWTRLALIGDFIEKDPRQLVAAILRRVAEAAQADPSITLRSPERKVMNDADLEAAERLQLISSGPGLTLTHMRNQLRALAGQYETVRATMSSGPERTRKMEVIASQMRAFSLAAISLLSEFAQSQSPGERLVAVTFLEARPQREYYRWLAERTELEVAFIAYHAAVALLNASRNVSPADREILKYAIAYALEVTSALPKSSDRHTVLRAAIANLDGSEHR